MKRRFRNAILPATSLLCGALISCSSTEYRTKYTDKNMRLMIDPVSISVENYVRIQTALVQQDKWTILDRASGLAAIKYEQEQLHRNATDRYEDKEKWAQWGKLYGVGAVIVAHIQCYPETSIWHAGMINSQGCDQFINLVDANSGEVVLGVENKVFVEARATPDWKEIIEKLAEIYPETFRREPTSVRLETYRAESEEAARRKKEGN